MISAPRPARHGGERGAGHAAKQPLGSGNGHLDSVGHGSTRARIEHNLHIVTRPRTDLRHRLGHIARTRVEHVHIGSLDGRTGRQGQRVGGRARDDAGNLGTQQRSHRFQDRGGQPLQVRDLRRAGGVIDAELLRGFLVGQKLTAGSSGWLADSFAQDDSTVDAIVNYEAVLLRLNRARTTPLTLIYPQDGVISADYPLMLLDASRRADYDVLVQHLKARKFQRGPVRQAWLRPSNPDIAPDPALPTSAVAELAFPNQLAVIDAVLTAYQGELRRPATSIFVLDTSGSMRGERLDQLKEALVLLSGARASAASQRYAAFQTRERIVLLPFSGAVGKPEQIEYSQATLAADQERVIAYSGALRAQGQTAIYDALQRAITLAQHESGSEGSSDDERFVSIVLLSDGENTAGTDFAQFARSPALAALREARIRIFPILFGEASQQEMQQLAELTGGRMFDARSSALPLIFKEIRGYQ